MTDNPLAMEIAKQLKQNYDLSDKSDDEIEELAEMMIEDTYGEEDE